MMSKEKCEKLGFTNWSKNKIAKEIRKELKDFFGKQIKFSVTSQYTGYNKYINIQIKEIIKDFIYSPDEYAEELKNAFPGDERMQESLMYRYHNMDLNIVTEDVIDSIKLIANYYNYNNSDVYTDYFDYNYIVNIEGDNIIVI